MSTSLQVMGERDASDGLLEHNGWGRGRIDRAPGGSTGQLLRRAYNSTRSEVNPKSIDINNI